jgi:hypothetical protein
MVLGGAGRTGRHAVQWWHLACGDRPRGTGSRRGAGPRKGLSTKRPSRAPLHIRQWSGRLISNHEIDGERHEHFRQQNLRGDHRQHDLFQRRHRLGPCGYAGRLIPTFLFIRVSRLVAAGPKGLAVFFDHQRGTGSDMDGALAVSDFSLGFAVSGTGACPEKTASGLVRRLNAMLSLAPVAKLLSAAQVQSPSDAIAAMQSIMASVSRGDITPSEAMTLSGLVDVFVKTLEAHDFEARLARLEETTG